MLLPSEVLYNNGKKLEILNSVEYIFCLFKGALHEMYIYIINNMNEIFLT